MFRTPSGIPFTVLDPVWILAELSWARMAWVLREVAALRILLAACLLRFRLF